MPRRERASVIAVDWMEVIGDAVTDLNSSVEELMRGVGTAVSGGPADWVRIQSAVELALVQVREVRDMVEPLREQVRGNDHAMELIAMLAVTGEVTDHVARRVRELHGAACQAAA